MNLIEKILGGVAGPVVDYLNERQKIRSAERIRKAELADATHKRQIELVSQGLAADAQWELEQIRNSGWKDEYVLLVLSIPLVGCFIKPIAPHVLTGFEILNRTPQWYQWLVLGVFAAIYGIRVWRRNSTT